MSPKATTTLLALGLLALLATSACLAEPLPQQPGADSPDMMLPGRAPRALLNYAAYTPAPPPVVSQILAPQPGILRSQSPRLKLLLQWAQLEVRALLLSRRLLLL